MLKVLIFPGLIYILNAGREYSMASSIINEVYEEIRKCNVRNDSSAIPRSDEFNNTTAAVLGISPDLFGKIIRVLQNAHWLFAFEIILADKLREIPSVEGYVVCDITVVRRLKNVYQRELMHEYNHQHNKNYMVHQIIKEIFPVIRSFNNTPLGELANKAIMLEELEKLMEKGYNQYTDEYQQQQLALEISKANLEKLIEGSKAKQKEAAEASVPPPRTDAVRKKMGPVSERAVDSKTYGDFISKTGKYPLQRILNIYGLEFFYKVNLRACQFSYLMKIINDRQISKRSDLQNLRDLLKTVRSNISRDPKLKEYAEDIYELDKAIVHHLYFNEKDIKRKQ